MSEPSLNPTINELVKAYPEPVKSLFHEIRSLIFDVALDKQLGSIEETLKWGQPAYLCKSGSTIRVHWNQQQENSFEILFNCKTILIETFKEVYQGEFNYRGNRVIVLSLTEPLPASLKSCIYMALNYHNLKKLPLLGAD